jgi:hypothetical protein
MRFSDISRGLRPAAYPIAVVGVARCGPWTGQMRVSRLVGNEVAGLHIARGCREPLMNVACYHSARFFVDRGYRQAQVLPDPGAWPLLGTTPMCPKAYLSNAWLKPGGACADKEISFSANGCSVVAQGSI